MGTPATGTVGIRLEPLALQGEQLLLPERVLAPTLSLLSQSGLPMRLRIALHGNTASGSLEITGRDRDGFAITETTPIFPIAETVTQSAEVEREDYVTTHIFAHVDGIAVTGLTDGVIRIGGILASDRSLPAAMETEKKIEQISFDEARGTLDMHTRIIENTLAAEIGKFEMQLYNDGCLFAPYMSVSAHPEIATIPAIPLSLKEQTDIASSPLSLSLTTQPKPPGMLLQFVVTDGPTTGNPTITISGKSAGKTVTETLRYPNQGTATLYSEHVYSLIDFNGLTFTEFADASVTINGVFAFEYDFTPDNDNLYTAVLEQFTGTESSILPLSFWEELTLEGGATKEHMISAKGQAQDKAEIGDRRASDMHTSSATTLSQSEESAHAGWQTMVYIDPASTLPFTTAYEDLLEWKIAIKTGNTPRYTATNRQTYNRVYRRKREVTLDATIDFTNLKEYEQWRKNKKRYFAFDLKGPFIGMDGSTPVYKRWKILLVLKYQSFPIDAQMDKEKVEAKITGRCEYDPELGYSHRIVVVSQQAPPVAL